MFASKPLSERNSDPLPHMGLVSGSRFGSAGWATTLDPRPEFQYGKLPANPILVDYRQYHTGGESALRWLQAFDFPEHPMGKHAHRILHLLAIRARL